MKPKKEKKVARGAWPGEDTEAAEIIDRGYTDMANDNDDSDDGY